MNVTQMRHLRAAINGDAHGLAMRATMLSADLYRLLELIPDASELHPELKKALELAYELAERLREANSAVYRNLMLSDKLDKAGA